MMLDVIKNFALGIITGVIMSAFTFLGAYSVNISSNRVNQAIITCEKHDLIDTVSLFDFTCNDGATFKYKEKK